MTSSNELIDSEILARYLYDKQLIRANGTVRHNAFLPPPQENCLSVFQVTGLSENEKWELGEKHGRKKPLLGRAEIDDSCVNEIGLKSERDDNHPRHVNIIGWPANKEARRIKAIEIAQKAKLFLKDIPLC